MDFEKVIFDYDDTLVCAKTNQVLPLLDRLVQMGIKKIRIWSNGTKWMHDGVLAGLGIQVEAFEVPSFVPPTVDIHEYLAIFEDVKTKAEAIGQGHNISTLKFTDHLKDDELLVDDMADVWGAMKGSSRTKVLTPEEFLAKL